MRAALRVVCVALLLQCAALGFADFVHAQSSDGVISPPPERLIATPGGVDMRTGRYAYSQTDLSIGEDSPTGALALTRTMATLVPGSPNPFGNFAHNFNITVSEKRVNIVEGDYKQGSGLDYRIMVTSDGLSDTFDSRTSQTSFNQVGRAGYARLTYVGARDSAGVVYTYTASGGTRYVFRPLGNRDCSSVWRCAYVSEITYADGTRYTLQYENPTPGVANTTRLRRVTSSRGYAMVLEYGAGADWNLVYKACVINLAYATAPANNVCPASALGTVTCTYTTNAFGQRWIASAVDANGATWGFGYPSASTMTYTRPGEAAPWLTNTGGYAAITSDGVAAFRVSRQDFADGSFYSYAYEDGPPIEGEPVQILGGSYTNALNETTIVELGLFRLPESMTPPGPVECCNIQWQFTPGPIRVVDPLGRTTLTDYCDPNAMANLPAYIRHRCIVLANPVSTTSPEGIKTDMTWDRRNLILARQKPRSGVTPVLPDIVQSATYVCGLDLVNCNHPASYTDARGNVSNYTYNSVHGGILTASAPAVTSTTPTGATTANVRPQTRYEYVQRTAWISNGAGGYVQAGGPIWVLSATSACRTSAATGNTAAPCAVAGDEVRTTFDYGPDSGPNTLLLRGQVVTADGVSLRTCYGYDQRGRRISTTQPNANLASCP
jgi:hypothetical protein